MSKSNTTQKDDSTNDDIQFSDATENPTATTGVSTVGTAPTDSSAMKDAPSSVIDSTDLSGVSSIPSTQTNPNDSTPNLTEQAIVSQGSEIINGFIENYKKESLVLQQNIENQTEKETINDYYKHLINNWQEIVTKANSEEITTPNQAFANILDENSINSEKNLQEQIALTNFSEAQQNIITNSIITLNSATTNNADKVNTLNEVITQKNQSFQETIQTLLQDPGNNNNTIRNTLSDLATTPYSDLRVFNNLSSKNPEKIKDFQQSLLSYAKLMDINVPQHKIDTQVTPQQTPVNKQTPDNQQTPVINQLSSVPRKNPYSNTLINQPPQYTPPKYTPPQQQAETIPKQKPKKTNLLKSITSKISKFIKLFKRKEPKKTAFFEWLTSKLSKLVTYLKTKIQKIKGQSQTNSVSSQTNKPNNDIPLNNLSPNKTPIKQNKQSNENTPINPTNNVNDTQKDVTPNIKQQKEPSQPTPDDTNVPAPPEPHWHKAHKSKIPELTDDDKTMIIDLNTIINESYPAVAKNTKKLLEKYIDLHGKETIDKIINSGTKPTSELLKEYTEHSNEMRFPTLGHTNNDRKMGPVGRSN